VWVGCVDFRGEFDRTAFPRFHATSHHLLAVFVFRFEQSRFAFPLPVKFKATPGVKNHGNYQGLRWTDQRFFLKVT
jgi:hypothetical protein